MASRYGSRRSRYSYSRGYDNGYGYGQWAPYVPVAQRRQQAAQRAAELRKQGKSTSPIVIEGRTIARTFWGKAWCDNLEAYSDFSNRLPRGRTYVRNGSVIDLAIEPGRVKALVSGSSIYTVEIAVTPVPQPQWKTIIHSCAGSIDSVVELLSGRLADGVMDILCKRGDGLFPTPREIKLSCSCPDSATMCKHVAATLYGVGARLDDQPELLFKLRKVDQLDLIKHAPMAGKLGRKQRVQDSAALEGTNLGDLFGIEMDPAGAPTGSPPAAVRAAAKKTPRAATKATGSRRVAGRPAAGSATRTPSGGRRRRGAPRSAAHKRTMKA